MTKKLFSIISKLSLLFFLSLFLISCGDDNKPTPRPTQCLTNSTLECIPIPYNPDSFLDVIEEECQSGISIEGTVNVFGKVWRVINFPKAFKECWNGNKSSNLVKRAKDSSSLLFYFGTNELSSEINTKELFLDFTSHEADARPYTTLSEFINKECWTGISIGNIENDGSKDWLLVTLPQSFRKCYNFWEMEDIPNELDELEYAVTLGIRVDDTPPSVSSKRDLLNLSFKESIEGTHISD